MPDIVNNYTNEQIASAAYKDTGVDPDQVPLNSDLGTASTADVQTSPTDATAGAILNNETTSIGGFLNYTGANYQPEERGGLGVPTEIRNNSGASIATGATAIGSLLRVIVRDSNGVVTSSAALNASHVYENVGVTCPDNQLTTFLRIS